MIELFRIRNKGKTIYEFNAVDLDYKNIDLRDYRGKVLLIVNTGRKSHHVD